MRHEPKFGGCAPWGLELGPHLTQCCVARAEAYHRTKSWHLDPSSRLATINMGRKLGAVPFLGGGAGPHQAQCSLGRGLPPYQVASSSMQPFGHNRYGPKIGGCAPLGEGDLGPHLAQSGQAEAYLRAKFHVDPSNRLVTVHQRYRGDRQDRQTAQTTIPYSIGRTVLQTVAQK